MRRIGLAAILVGCGAASVVPDSGVDAGIELGSDAGLDAHVVANGCGAVTLAEGVGCEVLGGPLVAPRDVWALRDGTIVASEMGAGRIVRLEGDAWVPVAEGLSAPIGVREAADGRLVVAEETAHAVAWIDRATGARTELAGGLHNVTYLALDARGAILVSSFEIADAVGTGIVHRVEPDTGAATAAVTGLHVPEGLFADGDAIVVADWGVSEIRRAEDGALTTIADGFDRVYGLAPDGAGGQYVGDHAGRVVHIAADGARTVVIEGIGRPGGIAHDRDGALLVAEFVDFGAPGRVLRLDGAIP
jgi:sugar lactone lactonase YvrE